MSNTFNVFTNVFGFIVAAVSLAAFLTNMFLYHLPSNKIKKLESSIDKMDKTFKEVMEEGFLTEPVLALQGELSKLKARAYVLQCRVRNAGTLSRDCLELLRGIRDTCQSVEDLRTRLMITIQEERKKRKDNTYDVFLAVPPPAHLHNPSPKHHPYPHTLISRPTSFSVEIQERGLPRVQRARKGLVETGLWRTLPRSVCTDPSCDRANSGSDVRGVDTQICISTLHTSVTAEDGA